MKNITLLFLLLTLSVGLSAQALTEPEPMQPVTANTTEISISEPLLIGKWILKSVAGQTEMNGQPVVGHLIFDTNNSYKGFLFGADGRGTYAVATANEQKILKIVEENGSSSTLIIKKITATEFTLFADGADLYFTK